MSYYQLKEAETINESIAALPKAEIVPIFHVIHGTPDTLQKIEKHVGIKVNGKIISVPSNLYGLVQHEQAYRPVIEGLTQAGIHDFQYNVWATNRRSQLNVFVGDDVFDSVKIGFRVSNSFDSTQSIRFGFKMTLTGEKYIELVGYRQVCANGMKIRVPLDKAEFITPEVRSRLLGIVKEHTRIIHRQSAFDKLLAVQYSVEALGLLKDSVKTIIEKSQAWKIDDEVKLKRLIIDHVGKRFAKKVLEQYLRENNGDMWSLANACTHVASHDAGLKVSARETLLSSAANMLMVEVTQ